MCNSTAVPVLAFALFVAGSLSAQTPVPYVPLSSSERLDHYLHKTFLSPAIYFAALGSAGGSLLSKDPPEWRQGVVGYTERSASIFASLVIQQSVSEGASAALHYDPRYLRCECHGAVRRTVHAFVWSFVTKNDEGRTRPNLPAIAGAYAGGMIPYLWYPDRYSPLKDGFREGSQQFSFTVGLNLIHEFGPELKRILRPGTTP